MNPLMQGEHIVKSSDILDFKVSESKVFKYQFSITKIDKENKRHIIYVSFINDSSKNEQYSMAHEFSCMLPNSKQSVIKQIGGWVRNHIWYDLAYPLYRDKKELWEMDFRIPTKDPDIKKLRSYVYLRSKMISSVIGGLIWKEWLNHIGISSEEMYEIGNIAYRISHVKGPRQCDVVLDTLISCRMSMNSDDWAILKSDMSKYNTSLCKWILSTINAKHNWSIPRNEYLETIKSAPDIVRKCKYGFMWNIEEKEMLSKLDIPRNRWQWFALRNVLSLNGDVFSNLSGSSLLQFLKKLPYTDISLWHYFKKAHHINSPYSFKRIQHMVQTIRDGARIYDYDKENEYGVSFVPIEGSAMRMLRNSIYNHRQQKEMHKKRGLSIPDYPLPKPSVELPEWLEKIRIKTKHEIISAGIECQHCIVSYANSDDIFVREGNVCAQISRIGLLILQCYDFQDQITKESKNLEKSLNKALIPCREVTVNVK